MYNPKGYQKSYQKDKKNGNFFPPKIKKPPHPVYNRYVKVITDCMKNNIEYSLFQKTKGDKKVWCVYFKDENGDRLNPIYVSKLKKMVYKGRRRTEPIPLTKEGRDECVRICEKSINKEETLNYIFRKKEPTSPNFIEMVRNLMDYDKSPYVQGRIKEKDPINRHTIQGYINSFNEYIVPLIPKTMTLKDIEDTRGKVLTDIRDKLLNINFNTDNFITPNIKSFHYKYLIIFILCVRGDNPSDTQLTRSL